VNYARTLVVTSRLDYFQAVFLLENQKLNLKDKGTGVSLRPFFIIMRGNNSEINRKKIEDYYISQIDKGRNSHGRDGKRRGKKRVSSFVSLRTSILELVVYRAVVQNVSLKLPGVM